MQILFKVDFDQGFEGLRLSSFARVLGFIKLKGARGFLGILSLGGFGKKVMFSFVLGFKKSDYLEYKVYQGCRIEVERSKLQGFLKVSKDDTAVAQRRLEDKQLEEKTNTDCLVKEQENVHLGIKVRANITVTRVPGQKGAEGNVAEKKKGVYER
ncbi:hypothetical protein Tco_1039877 [Tanacetum coccineum]